MKPGTKPSRDSEVDAIFDRVDDLMRNGNVDELRNLIGTVEPAVLDDGIDIGMAWLAASNPMAGSIPERAVLYRKVADMLIAINENPEECLMGLEEPIK